MSLSFEVLNFSFVFFRGLTRCKGPKISPLPGFGVLLSRVQAVLTCFEFPDHLSVVLLTFNRLTLRIRRGLKLSSGSVLLGTIYDSRRVETETKQQEKRLCPQRSRTADSSKHRSESFLSERREWLPLSLCVFSTGVPIGAFLCLVGQWSLVFVISSLASPVRIPSTQTALSPSW